MKSIPCTGLLTVLFFNIMNGMEVDSSKDLNKNTYLVELTFNIPESLFLLYNKYKEQKNNFSMSLRFDQLNNRYEIASKMDLFPGQAYRSRTILGAFVVGMATQYTFYRIVFAKRK